MREIKFRAWDKQRKCWLGSFDTIQDNGEEVTIWDYIKIFSDEKLILSDVVYPVDIEQYTGLKDRNGKEIFEGDIFIVRNLHDGDEYIYSSNKGAIPQLITWENCGFNFGLSSRIEYQPHDFEVIGNIHENPELLHIS